MAKPILRILILYFSAITLSHYLLTSVWADHEAQPAKEHSGLVTADDGDPKTEDVLWDNDFESAIVNAIDSHFKSAKFTFLQCYGGGFIDDLVNSLPADKPWSASSASKHNEPSVSFGGAEGSSGYGKPHTKALNAGDTDRQAFDEAKNKDPFGPTGTNEETPQYHSSGEAGDDTKVGVDADSFHAILFVGQLNAPTDCDYWNETVRVYQMLKNRGYPAANIRVLFTDGTVPASCNQPPAGVKPGDPGEAALLPAKRSDLLGAIDALKNNFNQTTPNEQLFFWAFNHGNHKPNADDSILSCPASGVCSTTATLDETYFELVSIAVTPPTIILDQVGVVTSTNEVFLNSLSPSNSLGFIDPSLSRQQFSFDPQIAFQGSNSIFILSDNAGQPFTVNNAGVTTGACSGIKSLPLVDLSIQKTDNPDPVGVGAELTYRLRVRNLGPSDATGVIVTDTLPENVNFVSASGGCSRSGSTVTCKVGNMRDGETAVRLIRVRPTAPGKVSNTATVTASETDPKPANNTVTAVTTVR